MITPKRKSDIERWAKENAKSLCDNFDKQISESENDEDADFIMRACLAIAKSAIFFVIMGQDDETIDGFGKEMNEALQAFKGMANKPNPNLEE